MGAHTFASYCYICTVSIKQRFFIEIAYDGTNYHGWQLQPNAIGVQEILNKALSTILREPIETLGCGRTDTGVHATQFFAHLDTEKLIVDSSWMMVKEGFLRSINALLPHDIAVKDIKPVDRYVAGLLYFICR